MISVTPWGTQSVEGISRDGRRMRIAKRSENIVDEIFGSGYRTFFFLSGQARNGSWEVENKSKSDEEEEEGKPGARLPPVTIYICNVVPFVFVAR